MGCFLVFFLVWWGGLGWGGVEGCGASEARVSEGRRGLHGPNLADRLRTGTRTLLWTYPGIRGQRAWPVLCLIASTLVSIWHSKKVAKKRNRHEGTNADENGFFWAVLIISSARKRSVGPPSRLVGRRHQS